MYVNQDKAKTEKWLSSQQILTVYIAAGSVTVSVSNGHQTTAAFQGTRHAIIDDDISNKISYSIERTDDSI